MLYPSFRSSRGVFRPVIIPSSTDVGLWVNTKTRVMSGVCLSERGITKPQPPAHPRRAPGALGLGETAEQPCWEFSF